MDEACSRALDIFRRETIRESERRAICMRLPLDGVTHQNHMLAPEVSDRLGATQLHFTEPAPLTEYLAAATMNLEDAKPQRVALAWRIVRTIARLKGLLADDEMLMDTPEDIWREPKAGFGALPQKQKQALYYELRVEPALRQLFMLVTSLPLLPAMDDLDSYVDTIARLNAHYGYDSSPNGVLGLSGMLSPATIRLVFPSSGEIMAYENILAIRIADSLGDETTRSIRAWLVKDYHFTEGEVNMAIKIGVGQLHKRMLTDIEDARAIMTVRAEDFISRSQEGLDLTNEAKGLKLLMTIQGLTKTEPEDANKDFEDMVDRVSNDKQMTFPETREIEIIEVPTK